MVASLMTPDSARRPKTQPGGRTADSFPRRVARKACRRIAFGADCADEKLGANSASAASIEYSRAGEHQPEAAQAEEDRLKFHHFLRAFRRRQSAIG